MTPTCSVLSILFPLILLTACGNSERTAATHTGTPVDDAINGSEAYDVYQMPRGGHDVISTTKGADFLQLYPAEGKPLTEAGIRFVRDQLDLVVLLGDDSAAPAQDSIRVTGWFSNNWPQQRLSVVGLASAPMDGREPTWAHKWTARDVTRLADPEAAERMQL